ncbi:brachyurin-like [Schistocerca gregaria]|uniref:brachyurin-like n=1 Tax=Schistocerca gregaria TaxID=7010 RepID=UPI00211DB7CE|nr:brachyurin-like [Schistocerca gregaria]
MRFHFLLSALLALTVTTSADDELQVRRLRAAVTTHHEGDVAGRSSNSRLMPGGAGAAWSLSRLRRRSGGRIINGADATDGQFPWQAAIRLDRFGFCGGSLISDSAVLTAAHCVDGVTTFVVTLGTVLVTGDAKDVTVTTTSAAWHPDYWTDEKTADNDIGVVLLGQSVSFTDYIQALRLPSSSQADLTYEGEVVTVSGWGITSDDSSTVSTTLKYVDMVVISNSECSELYPGAIDDDVICALGNPDGSPCSGDSGGALVYKASDGVWTQVGIVSFGSDTGCENSYPEVFTKVSHYLDWISQNAGVTIS